MSAHLDGALSVELVLTESDTSDGDAIGGKRNEFHHSKSAAQDDDDQVFAQGDAVVFKQDSTNVLLDSSGQLLGEEHFEVDKSVNGNALASGNAALQRTGGPSGGSENGELQNKTSTSTCNSSTSSSSAAPRRPSYTSKAPSALNTLPGITISEYSPVRSNFHDDTAQTKSLNQINIPSSKRKHSLPSLGHAHTSKESAILPSQSSFDESLEDAYSNPGTPSSVKTDSPAPSPSAPQPGHKRSYDIRERNRVSFKIKWDEAAKSDVLVVKCRETLGELYKSKLGSGSKGKCIKVGEQWFTPTEFEQHSGRGACKDWKRSIRFAGQTLHRLIDDGIIAPHAVSCTCAICCGEDLLSSRNSSAQRGGPVKLFVPYSKAKRKRRDGEGSVSKRLSTSGEDALKGRLDMHRGRSFSMDSEVFPSLAHGGALSAADLDDGNMPPMTPVTPMTPITPITPFTPMTPLTPTAAHSASPPKSSSIGASSLALPSMVNPSSSSHNSAVLRPPATPVRSQAGAITENQLSGTHWIQLEEAATAFISMAQQLKFMVEQAKIQSEAMKDTAVAQAKIQAENEKREAINQIRLQSFAQLSQALATVQSEKGDGQSVDLRQLSIVRSCQNCSRDALLECTGCHKVYYCTQFCQRKDWVIHQKICGEQQGQNDQQSTKADG